MITDILTNGSTVKNHISLKRYSDTVQHREIRSDRGSWIVNEFFLHLSLFIINDTFKTGD